MNPSQQEQVISFLISAKKDLEREAQVAAREKRIDSQVFIGAQVEKIHAALTILLDDGRPRWADDGLHIVWPDWADRCPQ